ncbi:hypothetical protein FXV91_17185 [Methanosarcina sp. DH2]|uniref:hypothetical protein n=1 Tax=Methanosarcina sp. DH2 TaxID=2605639 RepID=UPI001E37F63C|nr:hypothetical protein [Methanosarcina sp. DH2]MCC4771834.1 hypothetical protein [Methanosarcina sp. DH2]
MKNIAIIDNGVDICRIVPLCKGEYPEFKFSLLGNNFLAKSWELGQKTPQIIDSIKSKAEITYHSSKKKDLIAQKKDQDPIVHIKYLDNKSDVCLCKNNSSKYRNISSKIIDIKLDTCFPLPLCKLEVKEGNKKIYKKKEHDNIFDFGNLIYKGEPLSSSDFSLSDFPKFNVVEIYITSKEYTEDFMNIWPNYDMLWQCTTIDYLINGPELSEVYLNKLKFGPQLSHCADISFDQFNVLYKPYYNENIKENSITFYENHSYIALLATSRIQLIDMHTKEKLSAIDYAFAFDLEWQLKKGISRQETDKRYRKFKEMVNIVKDLDLDNRKYVFCMPQV